MRLSLTPSEARQCVLRFSSFFTTALPCTLKFPLLSLPRNGRGCQGSNPNCMRIAAWTAWRKAVYCPASGASWRLVGKSETTIRESLLSLVVRSGMQRSNGPFVGAWCWLKLGVLWQFLSCRSGWGWRVILKASFALFRLFTFCWRWLESLQNKLRRMQNLH